MTRWKSFLSNWCRKVLPQRLVPVAKFSKFIQRVPISRSRSKARGLPQVKDLDPWIAVGWKKLHACWTMRLTPNSVWIKFVRTPNITAPQTLKHIPKIHCQDLWVPQPDDDEVISISWFLLIFVHTEKSTLFCQVLAAGIAMADVGADLACQVASEAPTLCS